MERRFAVFLVITLAIWLGFFALRAWLLPPPPPVAKQPAGKDGKDKQLAAEKAPADKAQRPDDLPAEAPAVRPPAATMPPAQRGSLGSGDPASGYRMLVIWDNHGAAIERVELNGPRYKSVEDYTGYLGHLDLTNPPGGGAEVNVVGPGTPAALAKPVTAKVPAGLKIGDVIHEIDGQPVADRLAVENYLREKTHPGQKIILTAKRSGQLLKFTAELTRRPLEVVRPESHTYKSDDGVLRVMPQDPLSLLLTLDNIGGRSIRAGESEMRELPRMYDSNWTVDSADAGHVQFSFTLDESHLAAINETGKLKIIKRYELAKAGQDDASGYDLKLQVTIHNLGQNAMPVGYRLDGPTGLPTEGWWYSTKLHPHMGYGAGARDVVLDQTGIGHKLWGGPTIVSQSKALLKDQKPALIGILTGDQAAPLDYIGVDTQFFASAVMPQHIDGKPPIKFRAAYALPVQDVTVIPKYWLRTTNVSFRLATTPTEIAPGQALTHEYRVFFGPKDYNVLEHYQLTRLIEYGWRIFGVPAWWLQGLLDALHSVTKNYGIAIILLTVIVRTCMIPISLRQARMAAKMQELAPEVQKIKDRFPDDAMKQHTAIQELYKKHNFNMFGGCLPVFLQLPIFIGLYRCLSVNIELRDAALFPGLAWASNLAGPDKLFFWKDWMPGFIGDEADGYLGPFFNILPLVTVALFLIQQKMITPPATDEQTRMQQQMMTYMTVFMGIMFYKVPAGLCLYFITSSLWGICERKLLPKSKPKEASDTGGSSGVPAKLPSKPASPNGAAKDKDKDREAARESVREKLAQRGRQKR